MRIVSSNTKQNAKSHPLGIYYYLIQMFSPSSPTSRESAILLNMYTILNSNFSKKALPSSGKKRKKRRKRKLHYVY